MGLANGCRLRIPKEDWDKDLPDLYKGNEQLRQSTPAEKVAWLNLMAANLHTGVRHTFDPKTGLCRCYQVSVDKDTGEIHFLGELGKPTQFAVTKAIAACV